MICGSWGYLLTFNILVINVGNCSSQEPSPAHSSTHYTLHYYLWPVSGAITSLICSLLWLFTDCRWRQCSVWFASFTVSVFIFSIKEISVFEHVSLLFHSEIIFSANELPSHVCRPYLRLRIEAKYYGFFFKLLVIVHSFFLAIYT